MILLFLFACQSARPSDLDCAVAALDWVGPGGYVQDCLHGRCVVTTADRRELLVKTANKKLEEARISLRQERDKVWQDIQEGERTGLLSEDEKFRSKNELQKLVDAMNGKLEEMAERKEKEITS
jgi:hypothetical protein